ncbi:aldolase/citrate lyase family protein [Nocardia sp. NPDC004123]
MKYPGTGLHVLDDRLDRMSMAMVSGAEVVVLDLQGAVAISRKQQARATVAEFLAAAEPAPRAPRIHVRVNNVHTETGRRDLDAVAGLPALAGIRLPRVDAPADIESAVVSSARVGRERVPLPDRDGGRCRERLSHRRRPGVAAISLEEGDLRAELRALDEQASEWTRSRIVVAAAARLPPLAMAVFGNIKDAAGLRESCERGRRLGMRGRAAIHPAQLPIIAEAFAPTAAEVEQARHIDTEADARAGVFALDDGTFVDHPVVAAVRLTPE